MEKGVTAAIMWGVTIFLAGSLILFVLSIAFYGLPVGLDANDYGVSLAGLFLILGFFPPCIPALVPAIFRTRGAKEGATAGFITYFIALLLIVSFFYIIFPPKHISGSVVFGWLLLIAFPFAGALGGAIGGAIGGWRARRRLRSNMKEVSASA